MKEEENSRYGLVAVNEKYHLILKGTGDLYQILDTYVGWFLKEKS